MRGILVVAVIAALFAVPSGARAAASPQAWEHICDVQPSVVPGIGIGSVMLGESFVEAAKSLGTPSALSLKTDPTASYGGKAHLIKIPEWGIHGFAVAEFGGGPRGVAIYSRNNVVVLISVSGLSGCRDITEDTGSTASWPTILAKYGTRYSARQNRTNVDVIYDSAGIAFMVSPGLSESGTVVNYAVFRQGQACEALGKDTCAKYQPPLQVFKITQP